MAERTAEYYVRRRLYRKMKAIKYLGSKCSECGIEATEDNWPIFDFHHIDETDKGMPIGSGLNLLCSWQKIRDELDKCDLVCSNCHRLIHALNKSGYGHTREARKWLK